MICVSLFYAFYKCLKVFTQENLLILCSVSAQKYQSLLTVAMNGLAAVKNAGTGNFLPMVLKFSHTGGPMNFSLGKFLTDYRLTTFAGIAGVLTRITWRRSLVPKIAEGAKLGTTCGARLKKLLIAREVMNIHTPTLV